MARKRSSSSRIPNFSHKSTQKAVLTTVAGVTIAGVVVIPIVNRFAVPTFNKALAQVKAAGFLPNV